jgi:hypothetical protein
MMVSPEAIASFLVLSEHEAISSACTKGDRASPSLPGATDQCWPVGGYFEFSVRGAAIVCDPCLQTGTL